MQGEKIKGLCPLLSIGRTQALVTSRDLQVIRLFAGQVAGLCYEKRIKLKYRYVKIFLQCLLEVVL